MQHGQTRSARHSPDFEARHFGTINICAFVAGEETTLQTWFTEYDHD